MQEVQELALGSQGMRVTDLLMVRAARIDDIRFIIDLAEVSFERFGPGYGEAMIDYVSLGTSKTYIAELNDKRAGFLILDYGNGAPYLHAIAVRSHLRRKKLADQLMETALREFDAVVPGGKSAMSLNVSINNEEAKKLFEKFGFTPRAGYMKYKNGDTALLMVRMKGFTEAELRG